METNWQWLDEITETEVRDAPLPMKQLLENSVYYPASGTDGSPVQYLHHLSRSFIYVDYGISLEKLKEDMILEGFKGYEIYAEREVKSHEITPRNYRKYNFASHSDVGFNSWSYIWKFDTIPHEHPTKKDGNPLTHYDSGWAQPFKMLWTIWERIPEFGEDHGPKRISLLSLCAEGVASYDALYYSWKTKPLVFCIRRPGTSSGCNWTDFRQTGHIMHRLVKNNPAGMSKYMLVDDQLDTGKCYWSEYPEFIGSFGELNLFASS